MSRRRNGPGEASQRSISKAESSELRKRAHEVMNSGIAGFRLRRKMDRKQRVKYKDFAKAISPRSKQ